MNQGKYLYAVEKFGVAVRALVGAGDVRLRLYEAYESILLSNLVTYRSICAANS